MVWLPLARPGFLRTLALSLSFPRAPLLHSDPLSFCGPKLDGGADGEAVGLLDCCQLLPQPQVLHEQPVPLLHIVQSLNTPFTYAGMHKQLFTACSFPPCSDLPTPLRGVGGLSRMWLAGAGVLPSRRGLAY